MISEEDKKFNQFLSNRVINDVDRKLPLPDPYLFRLWCEMFYDKEINNVIFKRGVKMMQEELKNESK